MSAPFGDVTIETSPERAVFARANDSRTCMPETHYVLGLGRAAATVLRIPTAAARLSMSRRREEDRIAADGAADHGQQGNGKQETLHHAFHGFSPGAAGILTRHSIIMPVGK